MKQLIHKGVRIPSYTAKALHIGFRGREIVLTPEQEKMALAWVNKQDTEYAEDRVFKANFFKDFSESLGFKVKYSPTDFDFSEIWEYVCVEEQRKEKLSKSEKKREREQRRQRREADKERYGYAIVDGEKVEISNYTAEPSSIFIGRGRHPLRGRWKEGPGRRDIILNLSPDAPMPKGEWKGRVWQSEALWIAKWRDRLRGKLKYVWLSDSFDEKQRREKQKFDQARLLEERIEDVRAHTMKNLSSSDSTIRKIATVCYLIDALKLRVGDEKDKDEVDTVGATTLKPEHVSISSHGQITLNFLGKDSVKWKLKAKLPEQVLRNIREFTEKAQSSIFKGVRSDNVSNFLDEAMPGLTAKVFRTYHATKASTESLNRAMITSEDPDFAKKHVAKMANLEAAKTCHHKKKPSKNWERSLNRFRRRLNRLLEKRQRIIEKKRRSKTRAGQLQRMDKRIKKLKMDIALKRASKEYNLNTSLKSYIDPRAYYEWSKKVGYKWRFLYSKALQRRFQWVETE